VRYGLWGSYVYVSVRGGRSVGGKRRLIGYRGAKQTLGFQSRDMNVFNDVF
jgi:hypothetical protein